MAAKLHNPLWDTPVDEVIPKHPLVEIDASQTVPQALKVNIASEF
jgi:hypothetical protein